MLKAGLIINPLAGLGGPVALKGTDGVAAAALARGARPRAAARVQVFLEALGSRAKELAWSCCPGAMGADLLGRFVQDFAVIGTPASETSAEAPRQAALPPTSAAAPRQTVLAPTSAEAPRQAVLAPTSAAASRQTALPPTSAEDTRQAALAMAGRVDLLLFAGGDGTARDLVDALAATPAVLGIPAGVKMHSGVFASSPSAAAALVTRLLDGELLSVTQGEVRDIDEAALRQGQLRARRHGALPVPDDLRYLQHVKQGGLESEPLVIEEIAAAMDELRQEGGLTLVGAGATLAGVMASWGLAGTLLGVDALEGGQVIGKDLTEAALWQLLASRDRARLLLTFTGGQGYLFGRGNQQLSPRCIRRLGKPGIHILATKSKLAALAGRPLLVDTGERRLDEALAGLAQITTGYQDQVYYRLEAA